MKVLGPSTGYTDILNHMTTEKLKADRASGKDSSKTPIRPSASGKCTRELYYELMQYSKKASYETEIISPETNRIFGLGHSVEYHLLREFQVCSDVIDVRYKQQMLSFAYLTANDPRLAQWLEGSLDMVFWSEKHKCVADVKSKKDKYSAFHKSAWDEMDEKLLRMSTLKRISGTAYWAEDLEAFLAELNDPFFEANFRQLNLYANSTFLVERGVDHASIIQYNKNDSRIREVRFKPSRALYERTVERFQNVITAVDTNKPELAPREYELGSFKCGFCRFKNECWEGADAKKEFFNNLPKKSWPKDTSYMGEVGKGLEKLFDMFSSQAQAEKEREVTEAAICKLMIEKQVTKIRLPDGNVFELKKLKDGMVIRRSKA